MSERVGNRLQYAIEITEHIVVPEPQHRIPLRMEPGIPKPVRFTAMLATVQFDDQPGLNTARIDDTGA